MLAAGAVVIGAGFAPVSARADSLQNDKNNMRNLAILGGVAAVIGVTQHNSGLAVIGAGTAIVAGSRAERDQRVENCAPVYYGWTGGYRTVYRGDDGRDRHDYHGDQGRYNHGR
jgi:hypothetical protein